MEVKIAGKSMEKVDFYENWIIFMSWRENWNQKPVFLMGQEV